MMFKTGKASKKYDEIKILYVSIVLLIVSILMEWIYFLIPAKNFTVLFSIVCFTYMFTSIFCIYLLVGSRLIYVIKHPYNPEDANEDNTYNDYLNVIDISDFVSSKNNKKRKNKFSKEKEKFSYSNEYTFNNSNSIATTIMDNDSILNHPNNFFFNQSLEMLSKSENATSSTHALNSIK